VARRWGAVAGLLGLLVLILVRTAWISDDALITLRVVANWQDGWGPRWNVLERVQVYSHPLWFLLLSGLTAITREYLVTTMALGVACSLFAAGLGVYRLGRPGPAALFLLVLLSSTSWVDYATSGLENSLTYLLLMGMVLCPSGRWTALLAGLAVTNRMDTVLLALPLLAGKGWPGAREAATRLAIVAVVPGLWMVFATIYYGSPLPNTYYAKLGAGLPLWGRADAGWDLITETARADLISAVILIAGLVVGGRGRRPGAFGPLLYTAYWVYAGGDFMLGRFWSAPIMLAALITCEAVPRGTRPAVYGVVVLVVLGLGLGSLGPNLRSGARYSEDYPCRMIGAYQFADERSFYYSETGWMAADRPPLPAPGREAAQPGFAVEEVCLSVQIGRLGFEAGPRLHVVDTVALTDPFLARLPGLGWELYRPGHVWRHVPEGYAESVWSGRNEVRDPEEREILEKVWLATRSPLLAPGRWAAIWSLAIGGREALVAPGPRYEAPSAPPRGPVQHRDYGGWGGTFSRE
jgi:arabinofuranosyltransferase